MANFRPKFIYDSGGGDVTITLTLPPSGDNLNERTKGNTRRTLSSNGTAQHQFNYLEESLELRLVFLTQAEVDLLRTLYESWALEGGEFKFYESEDESAFITVTLDRFEFRPRRVIADGSGGFIHDLIMKLRRTK